MNRELFVGVTSVAGPEAQKFLQAIVSSDVDALEVGKTQHSLLLTPAGKVVSTLYILRSEVDTFLIVSEVGMCDAVFETLSRLLIRTKAVIEDMCESFVAVIGDAPNGIVLDAEYCGAPSVELVLEMTTKNDTDSQDTFSHNDFRISWGAISTQQDLGDNTIPQEANLDRHAVSFDKGCYLGQELVCRIDSREASTPFSFFALTLSKNADQGLLSAMYEGEVQVFVGETSVGVITSMGTSNETFINDLSAGPYNAIARISRKGSALLEEAKLANTTIRVGGKTISPVILCKSVSGSFST